MKARNCQKKAGVKGMRITVCNTMFSKFEYIISRKIGL